MPLPLGQEQVGQIRELRYGDGLSCPATAVVVGVHKKTVEKYAPGRPGKIDNMKLREAFVRSEWSAYEIARRMGWCYGVRGDGSRVKRTLGLQADIAGNGRISWRAKVDAETAARMAEAIGVMPWEVGA